MSCKCLASLDRLLDESQTRCAHLDRVTVQQSLCDKWGDKNIGQVICQCLSVFCRTTGTPGFKPFSPIIIILP